MSKLAFYNKIILSLGSNDNAVSNMEKAKMLLSEYFSDIRFSKAIYTDPVGMPKETPQFLNQVAIACTVENAKTVKAVLKQIEQELGRNSEEKLKGLISIDIDLLQWNNTIFKPEDLKLDYVVSGICLLRME